MNKFSPDLLIYILIIGGVLLFNFLTQRAAARRQQEEEAAKQAEPPAPDEPLPDIWGSAQTAPAAEPQPVALPVPARVRAAPLVAAEVRHRRSAARSLLKGTRNLQRAMVVLTVLGPCRAMEPPGGGAVGTSPGRAAQ